MKKTGCKLRRYETSALQYYVIKTEEPECRIEEILRSLVGLLPRDRRITLVRARGPQTLSNNLAILAHRVIYVLGIRYPGLGAALETRNPVLQA